jgi:hypothetical protein
MKQEKGSELLKQRKGEKSGIFDLKPQVTLQEVEIDSEGVIVWHRHWSWELPEKYRRLEVLDEHSLLGAW